LGDRLTLVVPEGQHQLGEQRLALGGIDRRRQGQCSAVVGRLTPIAVVEIAERGEPRQDGRLATGRPQEGVTECTHCPSRRQQDQDVGQRQWIAAVFSQNPARQLVDEAAIHADGEEASHTSAFSASASACGVPI
jgi:hypothetical protein